MNSTVSAPPPRSTGRPAAKFLQTFLHLIALGLIGTSVMAVLFTRLGLGIGLLLVAGLWVLFLIALVYVLFGVSWLEIERVRSLYDLPVSPLRWLPREQP